MSDVVRSLLRHLQWADDAVVAALRTDPGRDPQALEVFGHVVGAEHVWAKRIAGQTPTVAVWSGLTVDDCARYSKESFQAFWSVIDRSTPADLHAGITYTNTAGKTFTTPLEDILVHVALHGAYHRGQVSLLIRRGGGTPAPTDYIAFVRGTPAATRADAERRVDG